MEFTYGAYRDLLLLLDRQGYQVATYHDWQAYPRCVILRHDIDNSPRAGSGPCTGGAGNGRAQHVFCSVAQ